MLECWTPRPVPMRAAATATGRVGSVVLCCRPTARGSAVSVAGGAKSPGVTCERNDMTTRLMCNRRHRRFDSIKSRSPIHAPSPLLHFRSSLQPVRPNTAATLLSPNSACFSPLLASSLSRKYREFSTRRFLRFVERMISMKMPCFIRYEMLF